MYQVILHNNSLPKLRLEPVMPLLEYLHALPQDSSDRALSWAEDTTACHTLLELELPDASVYLRDLVVYYASPEYHNARTLCVWYAIARAVARCVQDGS